MRILIVTPAPSGSLKGNRVTAQRWQKLLRQLGHRVQVVQQYDRQACDVMVALHARKSASAVKRFNDEFPQKPLILALTGTDLYRDIHTSSLAQQSLELAWRFVVLQPEGIHELPKHLQAKAQVIFQSVDVPRLRPRPLGDVYEVCVLGHLRPVKDPFRAAMAARRLPESSRIRITHIGSALTETMRLRAEDEMKRHPRYRWLGELPRGKALRHLARCRLLVLSSKMEGGANAISEAVMLGVPVIASRINGSTGLLGNEYPGYFPVGQTKALTELLLRTEQDRQFYRSLQRYCEREKVKFEPRRELASLKQLVTF